MFWGLSGTVGVAVQALPPSRRFQFMQVLTAAVQNSSAHPGAKRNKFVALCHKLVSLRTRVPGFALELLHRSGLQLAWSAAARATLQALDGLRQVCRSGATRVMPLPHARRFAQQHNAAVAHHAQCNAGHHARAARAVRSSTRSEVSAPK